MNTMYEHMMALDPNEGPTLHINVKGKQQIELIQGTDPEDPVDVVTLNLRELRDACEYADGLFEPTGGYGLMEHVPEKALYDDTYVVIENPEQGATVRLRTEVL